MSRIEIASSDRIIRPYGRILDGNGIDEHVTAFSEVVEDGVWDVITIPLHEDAYLNYH